MRYEELIVCVGLLINIYREERDSLHVVEICREKVYVKEDEGKEKS